MTETRQDVSRHANDALEQARGFERARRFCDAIELLTDANRIERDGAIERELVRLRHEAFLQHDVPVPSPLWPVITPRPGPNEVGPFVVPRDALTPETLSTGIYRYGCVYVPGLISPERVGGLVAGIDAAFDAVVAHKAGASVEETSPWFVPFRPRAPFKVGVKRKWVIDNGGVWTVDSPRMLFELTELFREVGLGETIASYLGERPALSMNKCTLKRIGAGTGGEWHQDGAFLGPGIRTVNVWLSLSHCGLDAPGLDLVPQRLDEIVETGTEGAAFSWAVGPGVVERVATLAPVNRPEFAPGDALLFDDLFLHRTAADGPAMSRERYAVETWFFAPSAYPEGLVPILF